VAAAAGATPVDEASLDGVARTAVLRDPEGALFGLWQPAPHPGAGLFEAPGSLWWLEVLSNDVAGARRFYPSLFGWRARDTSFEPFPMYVVFERDGRQEGGILPIDPDWGASPCWNTIFAVEDAEAIIARNTALGGRTVHAHTVPVAGRIAVLGDAQGALFVVRGPLPSAT
jgi:predicted enzyme related to lactoylglutathione lyase